MMQNLLQLGLSFSVLCNCLTMWGLWKVIRSQGDHLNCLSALVMEIADTHMKQKFPNVVVMSPKGKKS